ISHGVVVVDEGVENFGTGGLCALLAVGVVDILEQAALVLQFEVVPVLTADKDTGVTVLEFKVMDALEDLRKGLAFLEVQTTVIAGLRQAAPTVVDANQILVRIAHRPAGPDRQRGVELTFDLIDIEG